MNFAGNKLDYHPPWWLKNGLIMTVYAALRASKTWQKTIQLKQPPYQAQIFNQADVPIFAWTAQPKNSCGTIIATYGITGELDNQWFLQILGRKAYAEGYDVILFDWRAHGKTAQLSPTLTSDGINEGKDFIAIAGEAKAKGFSPPFWLAGYSLGGQLALWGMYYSASDLALNLGLNENDIAGCGVICPNLDANRSLPYLINHPLGKYLEKAITKELKKLATKIHSYHPASIDLAALQRAESIAGFDRELVISSLGFPTLKSISSAISKALFNDPNKAFISR
ncbi:MAG: esterase [Cyanobacteria bacterium J083]|nr:MAG: esterase [Cyanobacteria bacterium J083]